MSIHIHLERFEGPLGLLLYLIRQEEMDIFDINIHQITRQYLEYIKTMRKLDLEIAGEFVAMAATLIHIKSRMLLPQYDGEGEEGAVPEDPRKELVQKLVEYQKIQELSKQLYGRPLLGRDVFSRGARENLASTADSEIVTEENPLFSLIAAYRHALKAMKKTIHRVLGDLQSISTRIMEMKDRLIVGQRVGFQTLITAEGEMVSNQVLVTFLSLLELAKMNFVSLFQSDTFTEIHVEAKKVIDHDIVSQVENYDNVHAGAKADALITNAQLTLDDYDDSDDEVAVGADTAAIEAATDEEILAEETRMMMTEMPELAMPAMIEDAPAEVEASFPIAEIIETPELVAATEELPPVMNEEIHGEEKQKKSELPLENVEERPDFIETEAVVEIEAAVEESSEDLDIWNEGDDDDSETEMDADGEVEMEMEEADSGEGLEAVEGTELEGFESAEIEDVEQITEDRLNAVLEAIFFATDKPVSVAQLRQMFKGTNIKSKEIRAGIDRLASDMAVENRGVALEEVSSGFQLRTKLDHLQFIRQSVKARPFRLSGPALEVLSIVAYKQPTTKAQIDEIRGVESGHLLRALMEKSLVHFGEKSELPGKPMYYETSRKFLEIFGLRNIRELPGLQEIDQLIPEGIGAPQEKETLGDLTERLSEQVGTTYSEGEEELLDISNELNQITTSSDFFEQEKQRMKDKRDQERAQDIRERIALGETVESKDLKWLERFDETQIQKAKGVEEVDFVVSVEESAAPVSESAPQEEIPQ